MHMKIHCEETKVCYYYINKLEYPYQEIGCMFLHETPGKSEHVQEEIRDETHVHDQGDDMNEVVEASDNEKEEEDQVECSLCGCTFVDDVQLDWHNKANHMLRQNLIQANCVISPLWLGQ